MLHDLFLDVIWYYKLNARFDIMYIYICVCVYVCIYVCVKRYDTTPLVSNNIMYSI